MRAALSDLVPIFVLFILIVAMLSVGQDTSFTGYVTQIVENEVEIDAELVSPYEALLNDGAVAQFVQLDSDEKKLFRKKVMELETDSTQSWDRFKNKKWLSYDDAREIWISRVVLLLHHEVHDTFSWSILDYSAQELRFLLDFCTYQDLERECSQGFMKEGNKYRFRFVQNDNPLDPYVFVKEVFADLDVSFDDVRDHEEALVLLSEWMNDHNWQHAPPGTLSMTLSYHVIGKAKRTTSHSNREFLQATLRALNIPTENLFMKDRFGAYHGGIIFPTLEKGLFSTDDIAAFPNKFLSLSDSLLDGDSLKTIETRSISEQCRVYGDHRKQMYTTFLFEAQEDEIQRYFCSPKKGVLFFQKANSFYEECANSNRLLFTSSEQKQLANRVFCS